MSAQDEAIDRILWNVCNTFDRSDLWQATRQDPEGYRTAVRQALEGDGTIALVEAAQAFNRTRKLLEATEGCPHCDYDYGVYCKAHAATPGLDREAWAALFKAVHAIGEGPSETAAQRLEAKADAAPVRAFAFQPERILATCPKCGTLCAPQHERTYGERDGMRVVASFECTACGTAWSTGTI